MNLTKQDLLSIQGVEIWTKESYKGTEQVYTFTHPNGQTLKASSVAMFIRQLVGIGVLKEIRTEIVPPVHIERPDEDLILRPAYDKVEKYGQ